MADEPGVSRPTSSSTLRQQARRAPPAAPLSHADWRPAHPPSAHADACPRGGSGSLFRRKASRHTTATPSGSPPPSGGRSAFSSGMITVTELDMRRVLPVRNLSNCITLRVAMKRSESTIPPSNHGSSHAKASHYCACPAAVLVSELWFSGAFSGHGVASHAASCRASGRQF